MKVIGADVLGSQKLRHLFGAMAASAIDDRAAGAGRPAGRRTAGRG